MNIWSSKKWKTYYANGQHRKGLRLHYDKEVDSEVKRATRDFVLWLRKKYAFPKRIQMYIKQSYRVETSDGDRVCGFCRFFEKDDEPSIYIATGDYFDLLKRQCRDDALANILWTIAHELTHYYQWVNDFTSSTSGSERQANYYANKIIDEYAETREHP